MSGSRVLAFAFALACAGSVFALAPAPVRAAAPAAPHRIVHLRTPLPIWLAKVMVRACVHDGVSIHWVESMDLYEILRHESSFNPNAQNPSSTAYGLFQFLDSTWATVGGQKTSDPYLQCVYGLRYIKQRYGTPARAWAFWRAHDWY